MPTEPTLLALPVADLVIVGVLLVVCGLVGWHSRRMATAGQEAALKRSLLDAKSAVPQLESAVRNREQRVETLTLTVKGLKERIAELETAMRQKDLEIDKRDREIRSLGSELTVLKQGPTNGPMVLLDGEDASVAPDSPDPEMAKRYAALEARYDAMARGLFQRDDRIAELEEQLRNPGGEVPIRTLEHEVSELEQTASALRTSLEERDKQLDVLQTRLQEEAAQRETFEDLARRRSDTNRELKGAAARFEQQIPALMETIKARDAQIAERDEKLVALSRSLKTERQQREAREAEIEDLQGQLAALESRQRELQQRLKEHDEAAERTAATLQNTIRDRDFKIAELEAAVSQQSAKLEMLRSTLAEAKAAHEAHIVELTRQSDEQRRSLEQTISDQSLALVDRELDRNELSTTATALSRARDEADGLTRQIACLTESLARSDLALRQHRCATMLLVARFGATPLLLPAPVEDTSARLSSLGNPRSLAAC
jgi:chromosome segregation ATPase